MSMWWSILFVFAALLVFNVPIMFLLGLVGISYFVLAGVGLEIVPPTLIGSVDSFILLAVPLFILVGNLMNLGGITTRLFKFATNLVGHLPGGLGYVNVLASIIFAGMSGSSIADAAGLGKVEIKAMIDEGYDRDFSAAITASSSLVGPIIPPSVPMVVASAVTGASLGRLLVGGILPGLLMGTGLAVYVYWVSKKRHYPRRPFPKASEFFKSLINGIPPLLTPVILLGGITFGVFTATEAAVVACVYALILGLFVYKEIKWKDLLRIFADTIETTGVVMGLLAVAALFVKLLAFEGIGTKLLSIPGITHLPTWYLLLITNIALLISGCFLQVTPSIILLGPILLPLLTKVGVDPVHFGVIMVLNTVIGTMTPPVASTLYAVSVIAEIPPYTLFKKSLPSLIPVLAVLFLCTYIPWIVTVLPNAIFNR